MRKLNENVREALASALLEDVSDPRVALVTVTSVSVAPDLRNANVYVTAHVDEGGYADVMAGLDSAKRRLRRSLAERVSMKFVPELSFKLDRSVDEGMRIAQAIAEERAAGRVPADDDTPSDEETAT
jgi:ribosome-binding factor A